MDREHVVADLHGEDDQLLLSTNLWVHQAGHSRASRTAFECLHRPKYVQNTKKHLKTLSSKPKLYIILFKLYNSLHKASLDVLLAILGHIPLNPTKEVKKNTFPEGRFLLSSTPKDRKAKNSLLRGTR